MDNTKKKNAKFRVTNNIFLQAIRYFLYTNTGKTHAEASKCDIKHYKSSSSEFYGNVCAKFLFSDRLWSNIVL